MDFKFKLIHKKSIQLRERLYFLEQFEVHNKIHQKALRVPTYLLVPLMYHSSTFGES